MRKLLLLSAVLAFLTGCFSKPKEPEAPPPTAPGVSAVLRYPVVLLSDRTLHFKADQETLLRTSVSSGMYYPDFTLIDSDGMRYKILKQTDFGKKSVILDMGTSPYHVYLTLKSEGKVDLAEAKRLVLKSAMSPTGPASTPQGAQTAKEKIEATKSVADLVAACERDWSWQ